MKHFPLLVALGALLCFRASAQITVELSMDQEQFLPTETIPVAVKITNRSGQTLHFGDDPAWLTFSVESLEGFGVVKYSDVPVSGEFDLESPQMAIKRVNIEPYFNLTRPGRYRVVATVRIKEWSKTATSMGKSFDVITGAKLWSQDIGMPLLTGATNQSPDVRKYTLLQANYLKTRLQLYVQVSDASESRIYKVFPVGPLVSFSNPESMVDHWSNLHVIYQSSAQTFSYTVVSPDGDVIRQEAYDYYDTRPRLTISDDGEVHVVGGVRRVKQVEAPAVKAPNKIVLPAPATQPPAAPATNAAGPVKSHYLHRGQNP